MHGKDICDPAGNDPSNTMRAGVERGEEVLAGDRNIMLYCAKHRSSPVIAGSEKRGWWSQDRKFYAFYSGSHFTKLNMPPATWDTSNVVGSFDQHFFAGNSADRTLAVRDGITQCRREFCACFSCREGRFDACEMKEIFGTIKRVRIPRDSKAALSQIKELEGFAVKLKSGHIVAMPNSEHQLEGAYWLAFLLEAPRVALQQEISAGSLFEAGWLVVKVQ